MQNSTQCRCVITLDMPVDGRKVVQMHHLLVQLDTLLQIIQGIIHTCLPKQQIYLALLSTCRLTVLLQGCLRLVNTYVHLQAMPAALKLACINRCKQRWLSAGVALAGL